MSKVVKIAQVGCGSVAQRGTLAHLALDDVKDKVLLVATMDVVAERAKACMEKFGAEEWYDNYDKMLAEADIDAVTLASPIQLHYEQSMKAIEAGKHVHSNKTISITAKEATDIIEAAKKKGVKVVSSPGERARTARARKIRQMIKEGIIGKAYYAQMVDLNPGPWSVLPNGDPTWYYRRGGGPMRDDAIYPLHEMTAMLGPAEKVTAFSGISVKEREFRGKKISVEEDDNTLLLLDFGESTFAFIAGTFGTHGGGGPPFYITGSNGSARSMRINRGREGLEVWSKKIPEGHRVEELDRKGTLPYVEQLGPAHRWPRSREERERLQKTLGFVPGEHHVFNDVMHLVHCIVNNVEPIVIDNIESMQHARHVIEIIEKGYIASKTGKTQKLIYSF